MEPIFISVDELRPGDKIVATAHLLQAAGCHLLVATIADEAEEFETNGGTPVLLFRCHSIVICKDGATQNPYKSCANENIPDHSILLSSDRKVLLLERKTC